jgi:phosphatidylserine decarboxylase
MFIICVLFLLFLLFFFRGKSYKLNFYPFYENFISCPADGKILRISVIQQTHLCISIFLNFYNVHIQYAPCEGIITNKEYFKGSFHPAYIFEKSNLNEKLVTTIFNNKWGNIYVIQIAGLFAKRIISFKNINSFTYQGEPLGLIKFGSRVDLIIPIEFIDKILVKSNDLVNIDQPIIKMKD